MLECSVLGLLDTWWMADSIRRRKIVRSVCFFLLGSFVRVAKYGLHTVVCQVYKENCKTSMPTTSEAILIPSITEHAPFRCRSYCLSDARTAIGIGVFHMPATVAISCPDSRGRYQIPHSEVRPLILPDRSRPH